MAFPHSEALPWAEMPFDFRISDLFGVTNEHSWSSGSDPEEAVCLMQRDRSRSRDPAEEAENPPDDPPSAFSSEEESQHVEWFLVYSDMPEDPAPVIASSAGLSMSQVAQALQMPLTSVVGLYPVTSLILDRDEHVMLVEFREDHLHTPTEAMLLLDVLCRPVASGQIGSDHPHLFQSLHIARNLHTFASITAVFRLHPFLLNFPHMIRLYRNSNPWLQEDDNQYRLHNGDHRRWWGGEFMIDIGL